MTTTISTQGIHSLSEEELVLKTRIENAIDTAGINTNYFNVATTSTNGELTIANMTSSGGILVLPRADVGTNGPITHQTAATGKVTLFYNGSTNVASSLTVAYAVVKL